ncbi:hypothetical protein VPH35_032857 [Triticum aestivum]
MKSYLIWLLKEHDVPRYRTQNAWSKEAWRSIVNAFNIKFGLSLTVTQIKQKEQDPKKDFKAIQDLISESGFGWDRDRMMVVAPDSVWEALKAREKKDALRWQDKSFPYYNDLFALYDGRYAQGRSCRGMDYYANKARELSQVTTSYSQQLEGPEEHHRSPTPNLPAPMESCMHIDTEEDNGSTNWFCTDDPLHLEAVNSTQVKDSALHVQSEDAIPTPFSSKQTPHMSMELPEDIRRNCQPSHSAPELTSAKRGKRQKTNSSIDDFHERYLSLKREEMERFAAIEERKLEDPYSIQKCIAALEGLPDLQMGDILKAADLFTNNKDNREVFLSFSTDALRLGWLRNKIQNT